MYVFLFCVVFGLNVELGGKEDCIMWPFASLCEFY